MPTPQEKYETARDALNRERTTAIESMANLYISSVDPQGLAASHVATIRTTDRISMLRDASYEALAEVTRQNDEANRRVLNRHSRIMTWPTVAIFFTAAVQAFGTLWPILRGGH